MFGGKKHFNLLFYIIWYYMKRGIKTSTKFDSNYHQSSLIVFISLNVLTTV